MARSALDSSVGSEVMPTSMPVSVIMQSQPSTSPWVDETWTALAVTIPEPAEQNTTQPREIYSHEESRQILYPGFHVTLYADESESYYHNLMSPQPGCFIIANNDNPQARPIPQKISLSFDEAHAYLEGDAEIFAVPIPPELYRWTERFVLENYCPEQRKKRKNNDWKQSGGRIIR